MKVIGGVKQKHKKLATLIYKANKTDAIGGADVVCLLCFRAVKLFNLFDLLSCCLSLCSNWGLSRRHLKPDISQAEAMHVGVTPQDYKNRHDLRLAVSEGCKTVPWWLRG
jgi:hypothetical protein